MTRNHLFRNPAPFRVAILIVVVALPASLRAQNLVHHWDFDTDGVVADAGSAPAKNGTLFGGATVAGGALNLNGSTGYVQFDAHLIPTSPSYTVSLYARASAGANGGANRDFISQGVGGAAFFIGAGADGSSIRAGDNWQEVEGAKFIADGSFHHYAITMTAEEASFYIDGALVATMAPFAGGAGGTATRLGRGVGNGAYFNGAIDDVRIYDDVLSPQQVEALAQSAPVIPVPLSFPRMRESILTQHR